MGSFCIISTKTRHNMKNIINKSNSKMIKIKKNCSWLEKLNHALKLKFILACISSLVWRINCICKQKTGYSFEDLNKTAKILKNKSKNFVVTKVSESSIAREIFSLISQEISEKFECESSSSKVSLPESTTDVLTTADLEPLKNEILELRERQNTHHSDIATNKTGISTNKTGISENKNTGQQNKGDIDGLTTSSNTQEVSDLKSTVKLLSDGLIQNNKNVDYLVEKEKNRSNEEKKAKADERWWKRTVVIGFLILGATVVFLVIEWKNSRDETLDGYVEKYYTDKYAKKQNSVLYKIFGI